MRKTIIHLCAFALITVLPQAHAYTGFGICNFGDETVASVICYGPAVLKGTTVIGDLKVTGPLTAENISATSLTVTGAVTVLNSKISGATDITGNLNANSVNFSKGLTLTSESVVLHKVKVKGSILINSASNTPYLTMECGTSVRGDVSFGQKAGIIQITDDSVVQGKVNNGSMVFIKTKC